MSPERRTTISEPEAMAALTHPVRLDLLNYLMAEGPATASRCARAVGDTPSNCSYHLRVLARHGLVGAEESADGRERPWRALITGYEVEGARDEPGTPRAQSAAALLALSVQRDQRLVRDYLAHRDRAPRRWRQADGYSTYTLRMTPAELTALGERLDALIRPYIAATREDAPRGAELVHLGLHAFAIEPTAESGDPEPPDAGTRP
ncbi:ArsR/SmtB family transcription factor [Rugosimonospora africana]|uniref:Transcriptional regulator n=1 Tax=Rugosimonospora africana TaxID=556532 RepID=A0A8J3VN84_9ACTN|nr:helix-turn-helix domain-containing protein [Rugosimonospora africana]GIH12954.1 transcriptional regulator [Rugosimonospora africana]